MKRLFRLPVRAFVLAGVFLLGGCSSRSPHEHAPDQATSYPLYPCQYYHVKVNCKDFR